MAETAVATLVVWVALNRQDALAVIALVLDSHVAEPFTLDAHVRLADGARVYVEVPRFGDPPPFAIAVESDAGRDAAQRAATRLQAVLRDNVGWPIRSEF